MKDYYKILDIKIAATETEIKKRYRTLARVHHPDKNAGAKKSQELFQEILNAYQILSDKNKRTVYDIRYRQYFQTLDKQYPQSHKTEQKAQSDESYNKKSPSELILKFNAGYVLIIMIMIFLYLFINNKKYTKPEDNIPKNPPQQNDQQTPENRPQSGELNF